MTWWTRQNALFASSCLGQVLRDCGFIESVGKACPPSEIMTQNLGGPFKYKFNDYGGY
jgi:hypothetical protein